MSTDGNISLVTPLGISSATATRTSTLPPQSKTAPEISDTMQEFITTRPTTEADQRSEFSTVTKHASVSKRSSRKSRNSENSKVKFAMAQLKMERLEEEQMLRSKQREKEMELERLQMEKELLDARMNVKQAEIEAQLDTGSEESDRESDILSGLPRQSPQAGVDKYLRSYQPLPRTTAPTPLPVQTIPKEPGASLLNVSATMAQGAQYNLGAISSIHPPNSQQLHRILERQQEAMEQHQETIHMMALGLQKLGMPKQEFLYFDGDPIKYPRFVKNFEVNVEKRVQDEAVRLSYLIQYCVGIAKEAIVNCVILPTDQGYREARKILRKNFGQKHIIVHAFIDKVASGPQIKASEPGNLLQLARDMRNCVLNSIQMSYEADINSMDTLKKIVKRLPPHLQAKWADTSSKLIEKEIEPRFSHLTDFVEDKAAIANTAFGRLVGSILHPPGPTDDVSDGPVQGGTEDCPGQSRGAGSEGHCAAIGSDRPRVSLRIVSVRVSGIKGGREIETYAFLDDGSDTTLCHNSLAEELGLSGTPINFSLTTVNAKSETRLGHEVQLDVKALKSNGRIRLDRVWTVDHQPISERNIPSTEDVQHWSHLRGIELPRVNGKTVTLLIGNDVP